MGQDIRVKEEGIAQEQDEGCSEGPRKAVQRPEPAWRRAQLGLGLRGLAAWEKWESLDFFLTHLKS